MTILNAFELNIVTKEMILRYALNLSFAFILIRGIYFYHYKKAAVINSFFAFNSIVFFVSYLLNKVELSTGTAFGLFAVFSILRFRTEGLSAKDMTYLFLNIALGLLSAISLINYLEIFIICSLITLLTLLLESNFIIPKEESKIILHDEIHLANETNKELLLQNLKERTGLEIKRFYIKEIDFLKDSFTVEIYYIPYKIGDKK